VRCLGVDARLAEDDDQVEASLGTLDQDMVDSARRELQAEATLRVTGSHVG
jgi:hypothetical protein